MKPLLRPLGLSALLAGCGLAVGTLAATAAEFEPPVRLTAERVPVRAAFRPDADRPLADAEESADKPAEKLAGLPVRVDSPGYAAPCWADVDGDGKPDLLVGQFRGGKIRVYKNLGDGRLAAGEWLKAGGDVAEVPGVW